MFETLAQSSSSGGEAAAAGVFLFVYVIVGLALLAFHIYVLVDILKYSDPVWQSSGQNKTLWIVLWVVGLCVCSLLVDLIYWFAIRPKLQAAQAGGGGYGGGYGGGGYPG